jgi:hypothetical protein
MKEQDAKLLKVREAIMQEYSAFRQVGLELIASEIGRLKLDKGMTPENMRIRAEILEKYRRYTNNWLATHAAPGEWMMQPTADLPDTLMGQTAAFGKWYADFYATSQSPVRDLLVIENLQTSVSHVTSVVEQQHGNLRQFLTQTLITPGNTYGSAMKYLEENFGLTKNLAETVFRGTVMQTFRTSNAGEWTEDTLLMHIGPPPRPMPNGHLLCIDNYGMTMTLAEWRELAGTYGGQGGVDPEYIVEFCGGYYCRHGFREVPPDDLEDAREEAEEYKIMQQDYIKGLAETENL